MKKKSSYKFDSDYLLIIVLLIFSGDPITRLLGKYAMLLASILIFIIMYPKIKKDFYVTFLSIAAGMLLIFVSQYFVLGFVSWLGAFNYINTFFLGGLILYLVGERFAYKFFIILYNISLISLFFFFFFNVLNLHPPSLVWGYERVTYFIYTYAEEHHFRNCGPFWEPAAFGGIIILCLAFNIKELPVLWKEHKLKVAVIVIALITTQSTSGYIVFFLIGSYYLLFMVRDKTIAFTLLPLLFIVGVVVYTNATFLQEKVEHQSVSTLTLDNGEFSNTRFGSFIFDLHYIKKHPLIGNGFDESTRYADNPELIQLIKMGVNLANANGFSNFMACLGIPFVFFYLLFSFKAIYKIDRRVGILIFFVITLSLISEQWLSFPLFTGIMFIKNKKNYWANKRSKTELNYLQTKHIS